MVIIFTIIYWSFGSFNGELNKPVCIPGADNKTLNTVFRLMMGIIDLLTCIIGVFTTVASHRNLNKYINVFSATLTEQGENHDLIIRERRKMAIRSFLYPLATCITLPFEAIFIILYGFGLFVFQLGYPTAVTLGLSGLLTGLAFAFDPATHKAFTEAYSQIRLNINCRQKINDNTSESSINIPLANKI
jgi:hypothetical protein